MAAAYGPVRGEPRVPAPDAMLMITPPAAIRLAAALAPWNADVRLSSSWARQISSGVSTSSRTVFSSEPPTLLTHTSRRPNSSTRAIGQLARRSRGCRRRRSAARRPRSTTPAAVTSRSPTPPGVDDDVAAGVGQAPRDRPSDALARARDDGDPAVEPEPVEQAHRSTAASQAGSRSSRSRSTIVCDDRSTRPVMNAVPRSLAGSSPPPMMIAYSNSHSAARR